jgi:hypothetical protein
MGSLRDAGIEAVSVTGGFRYVLPRRTGTPVRVVGWVLAGFGGLATLFMVGWMSGPIRGFFASEGGFRWFSLAFGLLGLGGLVPGLGMLLAGLGAIAGRSQCEVTVAGAQIRLTERCGLVRWSWVRQLADLTALDLSWHALASAGSRQDATAAVAGQGLGSLAAVSDKPGLPALQMAVGYPKTVLQTFAREMAERTRLPLTADDADDREETDVAAVERAEDLRAAERPPATDIVAQSLANGIGLSVPPAGLVRGSKGLFVFAIIWLAFCALIFGVMGVAAMKGDPKGDAPPMAVFAFAAVFIAIGVGMLIGAINMGTRRALIAVTGGALTIRRIGLRKTREWRFDRGEVAAVRMGRSGMEVNDKPVMELQIVCKDGKKVGFLSQRNEGELLWIAAVLRQALDVRAEPPARP